MSSGILVIEDDAIFGTESLINNLSRLPQLRVIARTSAFRYKGKETDPLRAGKELGVENVLTGRVFQRGETLIVQADLLDVNSGSQLWGDRFNRKSADIFVIQEGISREISDRLSLELTEQQEQTLQKRQTNNVEAYQLYLKGRYYWNRRSPANVRKGIQFFQQAIAMDPSYAEAYLGLAESFVILSQYATPSDLMQQAKQAALKALEIDSQLGEAYGTIAFVKAYNEWDWTGAEQEYKRAISINPNYATARHWYGLFLCALGRFDEAKAEFARALEIDPISLMINTASSNPYYYSKDYDQALAIVQRVVEMDPSFIPAQSMLANILHVRGEAEKGFELRLKVLQNMGDVVLVREVRREWQSNGLIAAQRKLVEIWETHPRPYVQPWLMAVVYSRLEEKEKAIQWLEKSYQSHDTEMIFINVNDAFDPIRDDPRFQKIIQDMNFPKT